MRLLYRNEDGRFALTRKFDRDAPPYAILSHTWSLQAEDEVTFSDIVEGTALHKEGAIRKLEFIAERAEKHGLKYFWVDTCCIEKRDEAELKEAIRSMYRWYKSAAVCYVYLTDVGVGKRDAEGERAWHNSFKCCRWMTRGWTLQELIAPTRVEFYARGEYLGNKADLSRLIEDATGIDAAVFIEPNAFSNYSFPTRLRWAHTRETTKSEDLVYSLMGLCDVDIEVFYGEGRQKARTRLEREIRIRHGEVAFEPPATSNGVVAHTNHANGLHRPVEERNTEDVRRMKLDQLRFETMDSRRETIKRAHNKTCAWVLEHNHFQEWMKEEALRDHFGFLWIKGKPGAGKSVLVKYLDTHISTKVKQPGDIVISFYFTARGDSLEKSLVGMYRSLLSQLLITDVDLQAILDDARDITGQSEKTVSELQRLFLKTAMRIKNRRLFCFVDALDECHQQGVQQMIEFFQELGQDALEENLFVHVCFASRHYPTLTILTGLQLVLEDTAEHRDDLRQYIRSQRFQFSATGQVKHFPPCIQEQILEKANHVFLWVVLVVEILKKEFQSGRIHAVEGRLLELPQDLSELFKTIAHRDSDNMAEFYLCLKWLLYAKRPLGLGEFYYAMMAGIGNQKLEWTPDATDDIMQSFLLTSSKGLAELTRGKKPRAQFIHESVREFLSCDKAPAVFEDNSHANPHQSHDLLKNYCMKAVQSDTSGWCDDMLKGQDAPDSNGALQLPISKEARTTLLKRFPFLEYATEFVFYHADKADYKIPQSDFMQTTIPQNLSKWVEKHNYLVSDGKDVLSAIPNLFIVLAENDCPRLIQVLQEQSYHPPLQSMNRYRNPLFAAFAKRSIEAARVLLREENADGPEGIIQEVMVDNYKPQVTYGPAKGTEVAADWEWALKHRYFLLMSHCLRRSQGESTTRLNRALHKAILNGMPRAIGPLFEAGANMEAQRGEFGKLLHGAAASGSAEVVQLLLANGADVNAQESRYGNALQAAASNGSADVVQLLLSSGANVNAQGGFYGSALQAAARQGSVEVVQLLLSSGADVNAQDCYFGTALQAAAVSASVEVVQLLVSSGADVNAQGGYYGNALQAAESYRHVEVVQLLLASGANRNAGNFL